MESAYFWLYLLTLAFILFGITTYQRLHYHDKNIDREWKINMEQSCKIQELEWKVKYMKEDLNEIKKKIKK